MMIELELWHIPVLFVVGFLASFLNSLAGGGSTISLPILIYLGIPPLLANGTNRFAILAGNLASALSLRSAGFFEPGVIRKLLFPVVTGATLGAYLAIGLSDLAFRVLLACALVFVVVSSNLPPPKVAERPEDRPQPQYWALFLAFFFVGFYGGLIQVGVGFFLIYSLTKFTGLDLLRVNALKAIVSVLFIFTSTVIFIKSGFVVWEAALAQAAGGIAGGYAGGKFQVSKGEKLIKRAIQLDALFMAGRLVWDMFK